MTEWASFPSNNHGVKDPNRLINHGHHHEQINLRIFGHQIDEKNQGEISEVAEGEENGDEEMAKDLDGAANGESSRKVSGGSGEVVVRTKIVGSKSKQRYRSRSTSVSSH